jgi:hypothetical protein
MNPTRTARALTMPPVDLQSVSDPLPESSIRLSVSTGVVFDGQTEGCSPGKHAD